MSNPNNPKPASSSVEFGSTPEPQYDFVTGQLVHYKSGFHEFIMLVLKSCRRAGNERIRGTVLHVIESGCIKVGTTGNWFSESNLSYIQPFYGKVTLSND